MNDPPPLEDRLVSARDEDAVLDLDRVGDFSSVSSEIVELAGSRMAPLAAEAIASAIERNGSWSSVAQAFAERLREQESVLALSDTIDCLLGSSAMAKAVGSSLHDLSLDQYEADLESRQELAAVYLESALRICLSGMVKPFRLLALLTDDRLIEASGDIDAFPKVVGIALKFWEDDTYIRVALRDVLEKLSRSEAGLATASYELASLALRDALRETDYARTRSSLENLAVEFDRIAVLEEARDDAAILGAACAAIIAFSARNQGALVAEVGRLEAAFSRRIMGHGRMQLSDWSEASLDSDFEWLGLVSDLKAASERLTEISWLDANAAIGQLARAYVADNVAAPALGLTGLIAPAIEAAITDNAVLQNQFFRALEADAEREVKALPPAALTLYKVLRRSREHGGSFTSPGGDSDTLESDLGRAREIAPTVLQVFGDDVFANLAKNGGEESLRELQTMLEGGLLAAAPFPPAPIMRDLYLHVVGHLTQNPRFSGDVAVFIGYMVRASLAFLLHKYDFGSLTSKSDYLRPLKKGEEAPHEIDLQHDFFIWLAGNPVMAGRVNIEMSNVATGRVDVIAEYNGYRFVTEVKRELSDSSRQSLGRHVPQAASYSGSNVPFGQLLVLDLTDHRSGVPPLTDLIWVEEYGVPAASTATTIVVGVVTGNRPRPSSLVAQGPLR